MHADLLLSGALVLDGTGAAAVRRDIAIVGDRISEVRISADAVPAATHTIDLTGLVLAPGFIDIHTHSDISLLHDSAGESKVLQGVTTEVLGNCGFSAFPVGPGPEHVANLTAHLGRLGDAPAEIGWTGLDDYGAALGPLALNVATLVGHGALRIAAMDDPYGPATPQDVAAMARLLDEALAAGAHGMSTGLTHTPSSYAPAAEIEALAAVCARHGALYATHARAVAGGEFAAVEEALGAAGRTGVRLQYSHLALNEPANWGRHADALRRFEAATASGLDAGFDVYPYDASSSALIQYLPEWVQKDPAGAGRRRALAAIAEGWYGGIPWHWDRVTISDAADPALVGRTLGQIADLWARSPEEVVLDLCAAPDGGSVQAVLHYRREEDVRAFLSHPLAMVGSDGNAVPIAGRGKPHPRSFGTFPRVLGRYVREHGDLALADAVRRMTSAPADRLGLADRGRIRAGAVADLVAFDPATVADRATFTEPRQAPAGVALTVVSGRVVARDGRVGAERPGRVLRRG
ncbi:N-acyl-D-amino-acid deacylase family protein [Catenulispora pinisilvae]|uniref:N-acyl-D-amino-acid deacylase family protein n=1 Tax=Catenulispora pinisilvae TaxID=2705253 RepID=UPI001890D0F8|nr:D-aminoacylase [Catenulispora pinisilvae]